MLVITDYNQGMALTLSIVFSTMAIDEGDTIYRRYINSPNITIEDK
jgi:hypothetical protein